MKMHAAAAAALISLLAGVPATAMTQTRPLPGYRCMMLNLTEQQSMDLSVHVPVRAQPSTAAPAVGWAGAVLIVKEPATPVNGFLQVLLSDDRQVWIAANMVRPYHSLGDPNAQCVPEILSNGRIGFGPGR
jgi:hypothetical protein